MNKNELLNLLCCPVCRGRLTLTQPDSGSSDPQLHCAACSTSYPVRSGIPDMVPPDVELGADWEIWRRHLDAFQARRVTRRTDPENVVNRMTRSGKSQQIAFASFTGIRDGVILDVGCGPGKFRFHLPTEVDYIGMDPMPLPEAAEFAFIRGVAEHIPLPDGAVRHITVLSAMDHFKDCEAFLRECLRILEPDGRLHLVQQIHERALSIRGLAHWVKDKLEDRATKHDDEVPHHMTEFSQGALNETLQNHFTIRTEQIYSMNRYTPRRLFLTLSARR